ncbi:hypothetical protein [Candidatus Carsonella ruddii]|uniref:Uncharacterized protein n=1 Tax=Candidatus Carsonella ruddii (Diaphorina cf. continua) TaxID=2661587 RepID=A0A7R7ABH9_CARRU|nr:hypothetical protein [Candidatus Carsonella ruddii (Diaphorina cf. continua)]BCG49308.1 hypothetical protein CRDco_0870 [Candidatus Carsonella ruddii (Diaphorina cf. continua)]
MILSELKTKQISLIKKSNKIENLVSNSFYIFSIFIDKNIIVNNFKQINYKKKRKKIYFFSKFFFMFNETIIKSNYEFLLTNLFIL